ncbi:hypothetical protein BN1708_013796 [Verticillium longisporum]|uniref:FAD/NAD(P)-binding domain-containing protein n=1 Tax=Verticillium longisporum TaxID=100787 RepID=A0A0G4LP15_VERLO|nr:hypothetical protein BN1708_013796 [Verticillium longisporum]
MHFADHPPRFDLRRDIYQKLPKTDNIIDWKTINPLEAALPVIESLSSFVCGVDIKQLDIVDLFWARQCYWRDTLALTAHLRTFSGPKEITATLSYLSRAREIGSLVVLPESAQVVSTVANLTWLDCKFTFKTRYPTASCLGKLMMLPEKLSDGQLHWKIWTMATLLTAFGDFPEDVRLLKEPSSVIGSSTVLSTDVVIVGGGNAGLIQAARLKALNVDFVVIEKNPQTGDNWAKRYDYMRFHIGKNYCQMPYLPYPEEAEYELPRDELQRHIQRFAREFDLGPRVLNNSKVKETSYDEKAQTWKLNLIVEGVQKSITCRALIIATGSGFSTPFVPEVADRGAFKGPSLHSSSFRSGKELLEHGAKSVIIIGSANSAFDVSEDCHNAGLTVQMIQRSPTYVIPMRYYAHPQGLGVFDVVSTEVADAMINMGPVAIGGQLPGLVHAAMAAEEPDRYSELNDAGFKAVDSTKEDLIDHLHSRAGGFVVDMGTGGVDLIVSGTAKVRSGVTPVSYTSTGLRLSDGTLMEGDSLIWCTGFETDTRKELGAILGEGADVVASKMDAMLGVDGEGELRGLWKRHGGVDGLWVLSGGAGQHRWYSNVVGLQVKGWLEGILPDAYRDTFERSHQANKPNM